MKLESIAVYKPAAVAKALGAETAFLEVSVGPGRALVTAPTYRPDQETLGVIEGGKARVLHTFPAADDVNGAYASDGTRLARWADDGLDVFASLDARPRHFKIPKLGRVGVMQASLVPGEDAAWLLLTDSFDRTRGRHIARVSWSGRAAKLEARSQPHPWDPDGHTSVFATSVSAVARNQLWFTSAGNDAALLTRTGKAAPRPLGFSLGNDEALLFDSRAPVLAKLSRKSKRLSFLDARGETTASVVLSPRLLGPIRTIGNLSRLELAGRELWLDGHKNDIVHLALDEDPVQLSAAAPTPTKPALPEGRFGEIPHDDVPASLLHPIAAERVQGWDLNAKPDFGNDGTVHALVVTAKTLVFFGPKLQRARFDFLFRYTPEITLAKAPAAAKVPADIVLLQIRTESGLTQLLCRRAFATTVRKAHAAARRG